MHSHQLIHDINKPILICTLGFSISSINLINLRDINYYQNKKYPNDKYKQKCDLDETPTSLHVCKQICKQRDFLANGIDLNSSQET